MMKQVKFTNFLKVNKHNNQPNNNMKKMISKDVLSKFILSMMIVFTSMLGYAQCTPVVVNNNGVEANTGVFCEGEIITFKANSTGYTDISVLWDFDYTGNTSISENPTFSYPVAGTYNVTFAGSGVAGSCTGAVTVVVKPSPNIKVVLIERLNNNDTQCFKNNNFCFIDSSNVNVTGGIPDGKIAKVSYTFSNGLSIDVVDPVVVTTANNGIYNELCVTITDPTGGFFDLTVQTLDTSGCLSEVFFKDIIFVYPELGISLVNVTPTNPDCDSTLGRFRNTSVIALADLDTFYWNFGDGDSLFGTPTTNTQYWTGNPDSRLPNYSLRTIPGVIQHLYDSNGTFTVMLIGQAFGCKDTANLSSAVTNLVLEPKIISSPNPACVVDNPVVFGVTGLNNNQPDKFLWTFGVPPAGNRNFNDKSLAPSFGYGIGPYMASLRLEVGPCDITVYDTIRILGVSSVIGVANNQVAQNQTYQCVVRDTVCMVNNSSFYQADFNKLDEDEQSVYFTTSFDRIYENTTGQYEWRYREWQEGPRGNFVQLDSLYNTGDTIRQRGIKAYVDTGNGDSITVISGTDTMRYKEPTHRLDKNGNEDYGNLNVYVGGDRPESYRGGTGARYRLEFLYTPPGVGGGPGTGDQTAIPLANPAPRNRDYNPNVWRVWTMGDRFAPQCTTDSRPWVNKNVGINCNWRIDSTPCHWYTPWDEIYSTFQDGRNYSEPQVEVRINKTLKLCYPVSIYADSTMIQQKRVILTVPADSIYTYYVRTPNGTVLDSVIIRNNGFIDVFDNPFSASFYDFRNFFIDTNQRSLIRGSGGAYFEPFNLTVRRSETTMYGTEFRWLAGIDTFISIYNGDTLYHNEDTLGRNNPLAGNGSTQWTVTDYATRITVPAGVTITTLQLDPPAGGGGGGGGPTPGTRRTLTGPQTIIINANEQIRIAGGDSIKFELGSQTIDADTTYAQPSTVIGTKKVFGVLVRDDKQEIFIDSAVHRQKWFDENAQCYTISLWHKDTITPEPYDCESITSKSLALGPPSAKGMVWEFGDPCPFQEQDPYILGFNMSETKPGCTQPWFSVNYDTFLFDVNLNTSWNAFNGGAVFGSKPQNPLPFVLPYAIAGNWPTTFLKGYAPGVIGNPYLRDPVGSFSLGLIVGNGPAIPATPGVPGSGSPAECLDTAYYPDLFRILPINASFSIIHPQPIDAAGNYHLCPGDTVWYKFNTTLQDSIRSLRWNWGYPGGDNSPRLSLYSEIFSYYKPYGGPRTYRNDSNIVWTNTDKWLYNYVVRTKLEDLEKQPPIGDTIVTSIIKDWKIVAKTGNADILVERAFERLGIDYNSLAKEDIAYYLGDGNFGCIDTTGISQFFEFGVEIYSDRAGNEGVFRVDDKVYRVDNSFSPPDTIETQHILHFRDSSVQGYDTLLLDTNGNKQLDTLSGLWMHVYKWKKEVTDDICNPTKKDTITVYGSGQMSPSAFLTSTNGCQSFGPTPASFNMGFFTHFELSDEVICKGLTIGIYDSIRYYQRGEEDPNTFPLNQVFLAWNDPARYVANPPLETFMIDWDDSDTRFDSIRSLPLTHFYDETGVYTMTIVAEDSVGCTDTTRFDIFITDVIPDFSFGDELVNCASKVDFLDLSEVKDPCKEACPDDPDIKCEEIISWEWDFGDDTRKSILQNPSHVYTSGGSFDVTLTVKTLLGCEQTITKTINIPGPQPFFEFQNAVWNENDTAIICQGGTVAIINRSAGDVNTPTFQFIWGDKGNDPPGQIGDTFSHTYFIPGTYELFMIQSDEIPGTGVRCDRMFPDSNPDILIQKRIVVIVNPSPEVLITADPMKVCIDEVITFTGTYDARYTRLKWLLGNNEERNEEDETINTYKYAYSQPGFYTVILAPEYDEVPKCWAKDSIEIEVQDVTADFDIDDSGKPEFCFTNTSTTQATPGGKLDLFWTIQELAPLPEIKVQTTSNDLGPVCHNWEDREGIFQVCLIAINEIGCPDTICKTVDNDQVPELKPYNVFTPGSKDPLQLNNTFVVEGQNLDTYEIKIFNRWGESVYQSTDITKSWNGQVNNTGVDCPDGTYYYIINYQFLFGDENEGKGPIEGSVQLIREK